MDSALITVVTDDVTINISKQSEECYKVSYYTSISFFNRKSRVNNYDVKALGKTTPPG
jgi:hypothetical protein